MGGYVVQHMRPGRLGSFSTQFGKWIVQSGAAAQCVQPEPGQTGTLEGTFWNVISKAFVQAWTSKSFLVAFNLPVDICLEKAILCRDELPMVPKGKHGIFLVPKTE